MILGSVHLNAGFGHLDVTGKVRCVWLLVYERLTLDATLPQRIVNGCVIPSL
jgi:hypothetical protein